MLVVVVVVVVIMVYPIVRMERQVSRCGAAVYVLVGAVGAAVWAVEVVGVASVVRGVICSGGWIVPLASTDAS